MNTILIIILTVATVICLIMAFRCYFFGHMPKHGYYGNNDQYFRAEGGHIDGIGREHWDLYGECRWCGVRYRVGKVHGPLDVVQDERIAWNERLKEMEDRHNDYCKEHRRA